MTPPASPVQGPNQVAAPVPPAAAPVKPLVPPDEEFWVRYSPHHEFPISSMLSVTLHVLALVLLGVIAWVIVTLGLNTKDDPLPVDAVAFVPGGGGVRKGEAGSKGEVLPEEAGGKEDVKQPEGAKPPEPMVPLAELELPKGPVDPVQLPNITTADGKRAIEAGNQAIAASRSLSEDARKKIFNGVRGQGEGGVGSGGGTGSGTGAGKGSGTGEGEETKLSKRQKRVLRWVMVFTTNNGEDYARQLHSLGAILAVPDPENPQQWLLIKDVSQRPAQPVATDLSNIKRIYWIDDRPDSVGPLARALGLNPPPRAVVAFFPSAVEDQLLELELAFRGNVKEDDIKMTRFAIVRQGAGYAPRVESQELNAR